LASGIADANTAASAIDRELSSRGNRSLGAEFASYVGAKPVVPLVADAAAENRGVLNILFYDLPVRGPNEGAIRRRMDDVAVPLQADADVTAQIPAAGYDR
jgi:hypothetical protein